MASFTDLSKFRIVKNRAGDYRVEWQQPSYVVDSDDVWEALPLGKFRDYVKAKSALDAYIAENTWEVVEQ